METVNSAASLQDIRAAAHYNLVQRNADTLVVTDQQTREEVAVIWRDPARLTGGARRAGANPLTS